MKSDIQVGVLLCVSKKKLRENVLCAVTIRSQCVSYFVDDFEKRSQNAVKPRSHNVPTTFKTRYSRAYGVQLMLAKRSPSFKQTFVKRLQR